VYSEQNRTRLYSLPTQTAGSVHLTALSVYLKFLSKLLNLNYTITMNLDKLTSAIMN